MRFKLLLLMVIFMGFTSVAVSQENSESDHTCPAVVETALAAADAYCSATGRNQVCYGHISLQAEPRTNVATFRFENEGDIEDVINVHSLRLMPMDETAGTWGVALMRLQANLPDTLPGQNVTFVLFGDVEITNAVTDEQLASGERTPMQAFYLKTGVSDARCEEAPESGLLVQTPEGVGEVNFVVNEVEVAVGSTVLFQAQPEGEMIVNTLEGSAVLQIGEGFHPVIAGTRLRLALDHNLRPTGRLFDPEAYDLNRFRALPLRILERRIAIREPLTRQEIQQLRERIRNNQPVCGEAPFPPCDRLPAVAGGIPCIFPSRLGELSPQIDRPICEAARDLEPTSVETGCVTTRRFPNDPRPLCPTPTPQEGSILPNSIQTALPAVCEPGICLRDPAEACRCVLCGIACPIITLDTNLPGDGELFSTPRPDALPTLDGLNPPSRPDMRPTLPPPIPPPQRLTSLSIMQGCDQSCPCTIPRNPLIIYRPLQQPRLYFRNRVISVTMRLVLAENRGAELLWRTNMMSWYWAQVPAAMSLRFAPASLV